MAWWNPIDVGSWLYDKAVSPGAGYIWDGVKWVAGQNQPGAGTAYNPEAEPPPIMQGTPTPHPFYTPPAPPAPAYYTEPTYTSAGQPVTPQTTSSYVSDQIADATGIDPGQIAETISGGEVNVEDVPGAIGDIAGGIGDLVGDVTGAVSDVTSPTTQTFTTAPWGPQQPYLKDIFQRAQDQFNLQTPYPGLSSQTQQYMTRAGDFTSPFIGTARENLNTFFGNVGVNQGTPFYNQAQQRITGDPAGGYLSANLGQFGANPALGLLAQTAMGDYRTNPFLSQLYQRGAQDIARTYRDVALPGIGTQFSTAGRYGSGAHQRALEAANRQLGTSLSDFGANLYGSQFAPERALQVGAQGTLGNLYDIGTGRNLQGAGLLGDIYGRGTGTLANIGGQQQAFGLGSTGQYLSGINALTGLADYDYRNLGLQRDVGQMQDIYNQQAYGIPWQNLANYSNIVRGNYGSTQTQPGPSQFDQWLGRGSQLAGMAIPFILRG